MDHDVDALLKRNLDSTQQMTQAVRDNTAVQQEVEAKLELSERVLQRLKWLSYGIAIALIALVIGAVSLWSIVDDARRASQNNHAILERVEQVLDRINDCTTKGGKCKTEGEQATAKALGDIAAEDQRQHDQLRDELRTGTTMRSQSLSPTTQPSGSIQPGRPNSTTTTTTRPTGTTAKPGTTTTTTRPITTSSTSTPNSTLVCVTVAGCL